MFLTSLSKQPEGLISNQSMIVLYSWKLQKSSFLLKKTKEFHWNIRTQWCTFVLLRAMRVGDYFCWLFALFCFSSPQSMPQMRPCHIATHTALCTQLFTFNLRGSVGHKARRLWPARVADATKTFIIHKAQTRIVTGGRGGRVLRQEACH